MKGRFRVLDCYVYFVLMYGSEAWSITSDIKKRLESCEMWFLKNMMKIPRTDKVCNGDALSRAQVKRKLIKDMSQATEFPWSHHMKRWFGKPGYDRKDRREEE